MARRRLAGKRIVITGASSGVGSALAIALAAKGSQLLLVARRGDRLHSLAQQIAAPPGSVHPLVGDVATPGTRDAIAEWIDAHWQAADGLINNAGIGGFGPFRESDPARLRQIMEVNFFAPAELIRRLLPRLAKGHRPFIANVSSVLGHRGTREKSEYCASKFALHGFSDAIRGELHPLGIEVILVSPSTIRSEFFQQLVAGTPTHRRSGDAWYAMSPEYVAAQMIRGIERGRRELILPFSGKVLVWLDRLCPSITDQLAAWFKKGE